MSKTLKRVITGAVVTAWLGGSAWFLAAMAGQDEDQQRDGETVKVQLYCPQEDSCAIDYDDGFWFVTRAEH